MSFWPRTLIDALDLRGVTLVGHELGGLRGHVRRD
jgi:hypothetical protein